MRDAQARIRWRTGLQFEGGAETGGRPFVAVDGDSKVAPSPVELLLVSAATCTGADIVGILEKQRVVLRTFEIGVTAQRRDEHPRRVLALKFAFRIVGDGVDETKARRAIDLSIEKYCTVLASLNPDIPITYDVTLV